MFGSRRQYGDYDEYNYRGSRYQNRRGYRRGYGSGYRRGYGYGSGYERGYERGYGSGEFAFRPTLTSRILNGLTRVSQKASKAKKGKEMVQVDRLTYDDCIKQGEYVEADCEVVQS